MVTIKTYDFITDAHIDMGRLDAEGITAALADQHMVQTDWLYSITVGGIKLQVDEQDAQRAVDILNRDDSDRLSGLE
ncbi:MAG: hypothetical protein ACPG4N_03735 [Gammaproteobacteria bacterium]